MIYCIFVSLFPAVSTQFYLGLFKNAQMQGPRVLRSETYFTYVATTKGEGNAADGPF
jgi:hypothetical protein